MAFKTYFGIIRDHSGSMQGITRAAARDYNSIIKSAQQASAQESIDTIVSVVKCGGGFQNETVQKHIDTLVPMDESSYKAPGHDTPLYDSVESLIQQFSKVADHSDSEVTFIIMATTDGHDNASRLTAKQLASKIAQLQNTDRWTFVFRVPKGHAKEMVRHGFDAGNILEWDQTERGVQQAAEISSQAMQNFYTARSSGVKSTKTFYSSLNNVSVADVKAALTDISSEVTLWPVATKDSGSQIRTFVESKQNGSPMLKGAAFYQLTKTEDNIQDYKLIAVRDKDTGAIYCGPAARDLLGLPHFGNARVRPGDHGKFDVFVQSTSVNRKLLANTQLMYWPGVGVAFKEGISAR